MKTIIKKITAIVLIAMITSVNLMAFEDSLKVNSENSIDLVINDVNKETKITFKDGQDNILFEQTINESEKFARSFNIKLLPEGEYIVEISDDIRSKVFPINITEEVVNIEYAQVHELYRPTISEKGSKVYLSQFSPNSMPLYVAIYNNRNELVYEETLQGEMEIGKIFDFSSSSSGEYRFYLKSKSKSYDHLVYVEK